MFFSLNRSIWMLKYPKYYAIRYEGKIFLMNRKKDNFEFFFSKQVPKFGFWI
jgi:hypothetical protein